MMTSITTIKIKPGWQKQVLRHVRSGKTVNQAARLANVGLDKVNQGKARDEDFAAELEQALADRKPANLQW